MSSESRSGFELSDDGLEIGSIPMSTMSPTHPRHSLGLGTNLQRASDLLMSISVRANVNRPRITNLVMAAMDELTQLALELETFWLFDVNSGRSVLHNVEYKRRFGPLDPSLEEILKMITREGQIELPNLNDPIEVLSREVGLISLQTEASLETGVIHMNSLKLVEMFLDVGQWSKMFSSIVANAQLLQVISRGEQGNFDGALQVMTAELHLPSPLVQVRESYFARSCKQLHVNTWLVVDVSLESIFPNPATRFLRKPSGCLIQAMGIWYSRVTWIEHMEVDYTLLHNLFKPLVESGIAYGAKRWIETLACQCNRVAAYLDNRVMLMRDGRRGLLDLADRMVRSYHASISASTENIWQPIPMVGAEDILVTTRFNADDPQTPRGVSIIFATTIWLPVKPKIVFDLLRNGDQRNKWDLLSLNLRTRDNTRITTGPDPANCVTIISIDNAPLIFWLQESRTNSTGSYVVYAPLDLFALNEVCRGENTNGIQILASGFTILPDRPTVNGWEADGTLLTIGFQIPDQYASTPEYLSPTCVSTLYTIISETASLIRTALLH